VIRLPNEKLQADLVALQNKDMGVMIGRAYVQTLLEEVLALRAAARLAVYEEDNQGSPWCGVCHRTVTDCDASPDLHNYGPKGPCAGFKLREALQGEPSK
jgi:hypothetical protein